VSLATLAVPFYSRLTEEELRGVSGLVLPLPSARLHLDPGPLQDLYERVLGEQGISLRELRVKYPRDSFFSKGDRQVMVKPTELRIDLADDELNAGRLRATLQFVLPRGSYATILVKRLLG
jgi:tRNA pseudouridine13 synthase